MIGLPVPVLEEQTETFSSDTANSFRLSPRAGLRTLAGAVTIDTPDRRSRLARYTLALLELAEQINTAYAPERVDAHRRVAESRGLALGRRRIDDPAAYERAHQMLSGGRR